MRAALLCVRLSFLSALVSVAAACSSGPTDASTTGESAASGTAGAGGASGMNSTSGNTGSGASGMNSTSGDAGSGTSGQGGAACANTDPGEPNDSEAMAYSIGDLGCSDDKGGFIYGVLDGPADQDWFSYDGKDTVTCSVNPTSGVTVSSGIARVCAYFECAGKTPTSVGTCPAGTTSDTSPEGRPGCCGSASFTVNLNCKGTIDDASRVYMRVDDPTKASVCAPYTLSFHY